jgi:hypothetical protein
LGVSFSLLMVICSPLPELSRRTVRFTSYELARDACLLGACGNMVAMPDTPEQAPVTKPKDEDVQIDPRKWYTFLAFVGFFALVYVWSWFP